MMKYLSLDKKETERVIKKILLQKEEIEFAYLFGSIAESEYYHDIDIAVYLNKSFNYKDTGTFPYGYEVSVINDLTDALKTGNIDLVVLNRADLHLFKNVIYKGILLFEKNRFLRIYYENRIIKEFIDTRHFSHIKNFYLKKKIEQKCMT